MGHSVVEILSRAFYALHDTKTPVSVGVAAMGLNAVFSFGFAALFSSVGWMPHGGLALANSLATALEAVILFMLMRRRLEGIDGINIARGVGQFGLASLGMAIGILLWIKFAGNLNPWLVGLGGVAIGGVIYGLGVMLLKVPELQIVFSLLRKRF